MSTFSSEKLSAHLPETAEVPQRPDLEAKFARLDEEWRELKEFLKVGVQPDFREVTSSPAYQTQLQQTVQEDADIDETAASPLLPCKRVKFDVTPQEAEAIFDRVEKCSEEKMTLERLERVERQCQRLTTRFSLFVVLILALMLVFMMFSTAHLRENFWLGGSSVMQVAKEIILPQPTEENPASLKSPEEPQMPAIGAIPQSPEPSHPASTLPAQPKTERFSSLTGIFNEPSIPSVKYVGSITSNKYHYPHCKWAKTINPKKIRGFLSVEEAQKAGYSRCPSCQPPLTDNPE